MSFVPATSNRDALAVLAIVVVAVLALFLRRASSGGESDRGGGSPTPLEPAEPGAEVRPVTGAGRDAFGDDEDTEETWDESTLAEVPMSIEGVAFVPRPHGMLLLALLEGDEVPDWLDQALESNFVPYAALNQLYFPGAGGGISPRRPPITLAAGDLTGARVMRETGASGAWRLETLGRDGDFGFHPFATREAAEAALDLLLEKGVVLKTVDDQGVVPASPEDFEEARRRYEATEAELAVGDEDPRPGEGPWVSDRR